MKSERGKSYQSLILRLLLDGVGDATTKPHVEDWGELLRVAKQNLVLVRLNARLGNLGLKPPAFFAEETERARRCACAKLEVVRRVTRACRERGVEHIFAKAFKHYPDMGGDLDLFVSARSSRVDALFLGGLRAAPRRGNLSHLLAGTTEYRVKGCDAPLEVHHGRIGALGEHGTYVGQLIRNARHVEIEGEEFLAPSPEDQLLVEGMQRVYGRGYIRLSDMAHTISLLRRADLDWPYVLRTAAALGTLYGLGCQLNYAAQVHRRVFGRDLLPAELGGEALPAAPGRLEFKDGFYRFPRARVAARAYAEKFRAALLSGDWRGACRLCLVPVLTAATLFHRHGWAGR